MPTIGVKDIKIKGYSLLAIRLWFYSLAFIHVAVTATLSLAIDVTVDDDPKVRVYSKLRWYLLTCWFNLVLVPYLLFCVHCDRQELFKRDPTHLNILRRIRDFIMTNFLLPVAAFADLAFLILYNYQPDAIAPPKVMAYMSNSLQHSLHTVSLVLVLMDLVLTPRQRPRRHKKRLILLNSFNILYILVLYVNYIRGDTVYGFLQICSGSVSVLSLIISILMINVCYFSQWYIVDWIWRRKYEEDLKFNKH